MDPSWLPRNDTCLSLVCQLGQSPDSKLWPHQQICMSFSEHQLRQGILPAWPCYLCPLPPSAAMHSAEAPPPFSQRSARPRSKRSVTIAVLLLVAQPQTGSQLASSPELSDNDIEPRYCCHQCCHKDELAKSLHISSAIAHSPEQRCYQAAVWCIISRTSDWAACNLHAESCYISAAVT